VVSGSRLTHVVVDLPFESSCAERRPSVEPIKLTVEAWPEPMIVQGVVMTMNYEWRQVHLQLRITCDEPLGRRLTSHNARVLLEADVELN